jgi:hypothetical protein
LNQAVVIIHGMGEQIPMETLQEFVETVWVGDDSLIDQGRPDSATGGPRHENAVWSKPDRRNRSFELRRMTTEAINSSHGSTDFFEFYWAHLIYGTTWEQLKAWVIDLLWHSPTRVPPRVRGAWILLWIISVIVALCMIAAFVPFATLRSCIFNNCVPEASNQTSFWWLIVVPVLVGVFGAIAASLVNIFLLKYFGDIARYVKATPLNVARRQEIREKGVQLLETLMGREVDGKPGKRQYDRIVVVAHSLGSIVAYDILTHCFARLNTASDLVEKTLKGLQQPERAKLESMIRSAADTTAKQAGTVKGLEDAPTDFTVDAFQEQQARCLKELTEQGSPWIISDFVTLGSPLSHAEFLLAADLSDLRKAQERRILPTCPPTMEHDGKTKLRHFTFRYKDDAAAYDPLAYRVPHHAALFAYTRWTNLHSPHWAILWGDIISGPLASQFGATNSNGQVSGIRDLQVLPQRDELGKVVSGQRVPFFSHTRYWSFKVSPGLPAPHHIQVLRSALRLKDR